MPDRRNYLPRPIGPGAPPTSLKINRSKKISAQGQSFHQSFSALYFQHFFKGFSYFYMWCDFISFLDLKSEQVSSVHLKTTPFLLFIFSVSATGFLQTPQRHSSVAGHINAKYSQFLQTSSIINKIFPATKNVKDAEPTRRSFLRPRR